MALDTHAKKNKPTIDHSGKGVHGKVCWLIVYHQIQKYLVSNICRPPEKYVAELDDFIIQFSTFLTLLQHRIKTLFIWGDFNTNLFEFSTNTHFNHYFKGFSPGLPYKHNYNPRHLVLLITSFCNDIGGTVNSTSGLLINDISDHKMISTHPPNDLYKNKMNTFRVMDNNNEASINNFCNELGSLNIYDHLNKRDYS